jgi:Uma2 family endonuclease
MTGGALRHNQIALNIAARLLAAARGGPCHVFINDVKLRIGDDFYYPDLIVDCEPHGGGELFVRAPCLVVEVLSDSTRRTDRREKLEAYRRVESLRSYLLVEQDERRVERHWRDEDGAWRHEEVSTAAGTSLVPVPCPLTPLTLDEIYEGVDLPAQRARPRRVREAYAPAEPTG